MTQPWPLSLPPQRLVDELMAMKTKRFPIRVNGAENYGTLGAMTHPSERSPQCNPPR